MLWEHNIIILLCIDGLIMENKANKIKIICEFEKEKAEWDALTQDEKGKWQDVADYLKEEWPEIITGDTLGYWQVVGMNNSGM